jgi:hypothetical protein
MDSKTSILSIRTNAGSQVQGPMELDIDFTRDTNKEEAAICVPSHPVKIASLRDPNADFLLRKWWEQSRHNIAVCYGAVQGIGPLFLVVEKREADQFTNCYYKGRETKTKLKLSGHVSKIATLALSAGFSCQEIGNFGFKDGLPISGQKWVLFIRSAKLYITMFKKFKSMIAQIWQYHPAQSL